MKSFVILILLALPQWATATITCTHDLAPEMSIQLVPNPDISNKMDVTFYVEDEVDTEEVCDVLITSSSSGPMLSVLCIDREDPDGDLHFNIVARKGAGKSQSQISFHYHDSSKEPEVRRPDKMTCEGF